MVYYRPRKPEIADKILAELMLGRLSKEEQDRFRHANEEFQKIQGLELPLRTLVENSKKVPSQNRKEWIQSALERAYRQSSDITSKEFYRQAMQDLEKLGVENFTLERGSYPYSSKYAHVSNEKSAKIAAICNKYGVSKDALQALLGAFVEA